MLTMEERKGLSQQKWLVFGAAAAVRLVLAIAFPELPDLLSGRVEISTPITSFKRCALIGEATSASWSSIRLLAFANGQQYRKDFSSITMEFPLTMGASSTRYTQYIRCDTMTFIDVRKAPLFLPLFSLLPGDRTFHLTSTLLYTILDIMSANALIQVSETQVASSSHYFTSPRADRRWSSIAVAAR